MMMKKVMILGAGIYQVPLIQKAKEMGLFTIVVSIPGDYPGFAIADKVVYENTIDYERVLEVAQEEEIDGILTTGTDVAMITVGYICDHLQLPGISFETAKRATDKAYMKECMIQAGVNTAKYKKIYNEDELYTAFDDLRKPVILKVVDKSGSRGIIRVDQKELLLEAYHSILPITNKDYILMEEFITGIEFGIDAFVKDGTVSLLLPHEKIVYQNGATAVPLGHIFPYELSKKIEENMKQQVDLVVKALKLNHCAVNMDAFLCDDDIYIIEAGARAGATGIPELISGYIQKDYYELMLKEALGESVHFEATSHGCWISRILISEQKGVLKSYSIPKKTYATVSMDYEIGEEIPRFFNGPDRIGQVIIYGYDRDEALKRLDELLNELQIEVEV